MKTLCLLLIWREWLFLLIYLLMHKLNSFYKQISNINVKSLKFIKNWFTPPPLSSLSCPTNESFPLTKIIFNYTYQLLQLFFVSSSTIAFFSKTPMFKVQFQVSMVVRPCLFSYQILYSDKRFGLWDCHAIFISMHSLISLFIFSMLIFLVWWVCCRYGLNVYNNNAIIATCILSRYMTRWGIKDNLKWKLRYRWIKILRL